MVDRRQFSFMDFDSFVNKCTIFKIAILRLRTKLCYPLKVYDRLVIFYFCYSLLLNIVLFRVLLFNIYS